MILFHLVLVEVTLLHFRIRRHLRRRVVHNVDGRRTSCYRRVSSQFGSSTINPRQWQWQSSVTRVSAEREQHDVLVSAPKITITCQLYALKLKTRRPPVASPSAPRTYECRVTKRQSATWASQHFHAGSSLFFTRSCMIEGLHTHRLGLG